jgi:sterol carrier protein 2
MEPQKKKVYIVGVGMTKFYKPSRKDIGDYPDFSPQAVKRAMRDANITFDEIEQIFIGYAYGDSCAGQRALYEVGMSGVPITNVNNNCATGSTAVFNCKQLIEGGIANCCLAFGFEKMARGSLQMAYNDRAIPVDKMTAKNTEMRGKTKMPFAPQLFGNAGREHMEKYGSRPQHFAKIAYKNHKHSVNNPYS